MIINFVPNGLVLISNLVDPHVWLVHDALLIQTLGNPYYFVISGFQLIYPKNFSFVLEGGVVYPGFTLRGGSEGPCFIEVLCHEADFRKSHLKVQAVVFSIFLRV